MRRKTMKEKRYEQFRGILNQLLFLLNPLQQLCSGLQYLQTIVSCIHYHLAPNHYFLVFQVVVLVLLHHFVIISWVLLIFCNRTPKQGWSMLPSNFFTEVMVLILYFWRKISNLVSSTFVHFFLPYINHVHSSNRTIICAVIVGLTPISWNISWNFTIKRGHVITFGKCMITREWLRKCFTQCNVKLVEGDELLRISQLHTFLNQCIYIFANFSIDDNPIMRHSVSLAHRMTLLPFWVLDKW